MAPPITPLQLRPQEAPGLTGGLLALNTFLRQVQQGWLSGLTVSENLSATIKTLKVGVAGLWTAVSAFTNAWAAFGGIEPRFTKVGGQVVVSGAMVSGTINTTAWTLPLGYRPDRDVNLPAESNGAYGKAVIKADGSVIPAVGNNSFYSLDSITFIAADPTPIPNVQNGPLKFAHGLPGKCTDVLVTQVTNLVGINVTVGGCFPDWVDDGKGNVVVTHLAGLVPGGTYFVRFLCLGEPTP